MMLAITTMLSYLKKIQIKYIIIALIWAGSLFLLNNYKDNKWQAKIDKSVITTQETIIKQSDKANTAYDEKKTQSADKYTTSIKYITKYVDRISNEKVNGCDRNFVLTADDIRMYNDPSGTDDTKPSVDTMPATH